MRIFLKRVSIGLLVVLLVGFVLPEPRVMPVEGATSRDWNKNSFWFEPWGASGVHKGIDIFAAKGQPLVATTNMIILYKAAFPLAAMLLLVWGRNGAFTITPTWTK